ncbi:MAG TPA: HNH endonuclease [Pseudonocardiaceae bacterium]|nr:HNH endonuclease [Pseudonocardiaceae bacterium]
MAPRLGSHPRREVPWWLLLRQGQLGVALHPVRPHLLREGTVKRSRLNRRTPLHTTTPLERTSRLPSSGPIKAKRRDTGPTRSVRDIVRARAGNRCELCRRDDGPMDIHHRRPRAMGGTSDPATNRPSNLVLLCRECHSNIESNRDGAQLIGWLVRQRADPSRVQLWRFPGWVLLDDEGGYVDVGEAA